jgi:hypothetical protein
MSLPRHLHQGITLLEFCHGHMGIFVALPYMGMQLGGSALAFVPLNNLGSAAIPNYATALRPVTYWVAVAVDTCLAFFVLYCYAQNASVADHLSGIPRQAEISAENRGISNR